MNRSDHRAPLPALSAAQAAGARRQHPAVRAQQDKHRRTRPALTCVSLSSVHIGTWRTDSMHGWRGGPVPAVLPSRDKLSGIIDHLGVRALYVVPHSEQATAAWVAAANPVLLSGATPPYAPAEIDPDRSSRRARGGGPHLRSGPPGVPSNQSAGSFSGLRIRPGQGHRRLGPPVVGELGGAASSGWRGPAGAPSLPFLTVRCLPVAATLGGGCCVHARFTRGAVQHFASTLQECVASVFIHRSDDPAHIASATPSRAGRPASKHSKPPRTRGDQCRTTPRTGQLLQRRPQQRRAVAVGRSGHAAQRDPRPSVSKDLLVPCFPRSTGDRPAACPPQGALTRQPSTVTSSNSSPTIRSYAIPHTSTCNSLSNTTQSGMRGR